MAHGRRRAICGSRASARWCRRRSCSRSCRSPRGRGSTVHRSARRCAASCAGEDDRLLVVVGPCSIHDPRPALEYARRLAARWPTSWRDELLHRHARLLREAAHHRRLEGADQRPAPRRQLRHQRGAAPRPPACCSTCSTLGLPAGCEFLDPITPAVHRRRWSPGAPSAPAPPRARCTASWPPACPCRSASRTAPTATCRSPSTPCGRRRTRTSFLGVTEQGLAAIVATRGNRDCHVILRGGTRRPELRRRQRPAGARRPCERRRPAAAPDDRHQPRQQRQGPPAPAGRGAATSPSRSRRASAGIIGVMMESFLVDGRQDSADRTSLRLRPEHHRRLHGLGDDRPRAAGAGRGARVRRRIARVVRGGRAAGAAPTGGGGLDRRGKMIGMSTTAITGSPSTRGSPRRRAGCAWAIRRPPSSSGRGSCSSSAVRPSERLRQRRGQRPLPALAPHRGPRPLLLRLARLPSARAPSG